MNYGAISAKVHALYGKMLTDGDWKRMCEMRNVNDAVSFLKTQPGWQKAAQRIPTGEIPISEVANALRTQVLSEFERLFAFGSREDKRFLLFMVYKAEERRILSAYNKLIAIRETFKSEETPSEILKRSKLDFSALNTARTYKDIIEASKGTIYYNTLSGIEINPDTGLPKYTSISVLLENKYYAEFYKYLNKDFSGLGKNILINSLGTEADILNAIHILRIRRYFPASIPAVNELIIPVSRHLSKKTIAEIVNASSEEAAIAIIKETPIGKYFSAFDNADLEKRYEAAMTTFCRKLIGTGQPTICVVQAYLTLKRIESERLIRVIEAIHYDVNPAIVL